jgi:hypothetical protein
MTLLPAVTAMPVPSGSVTNPSIRVTLDYGGEFKYDLPLDQSEVDDIERLMKVHFPSGAIDAQSVTEGNSLLGRVASITDQAKLEAVEEIREVIDRAIKRQNRTPIHHWARYDQYGRGDLASGERDLHSQTSTMRSLGACSREKFIGFQVVKDRVAHAPHPMPPETNAERTKRLHKAWLADQCLTKICDHISEQIEAKKQERNGLKVPVDIDRIRALDEEMKKLEVLSETMKGVNRFALMYATLIDPVDGRNYGQQQAYLKSECEKLVKTMKLLPSEAEEIVLLTARDRDEYLLFCQMLEHPVKNDPVEWALFRFVDDLSMDGAPHVDAEVRFTEHPHMRQLFAGLPVSQKTAFDGFLKSLKDSVIRNKAGQVADIMRFGGLPALNQIKF